MLVQIRKATATDSEFAYQTKKAAFREYVEEVWGWDEERERDLHERRFPVQDFRVISCEGTDVGIMAFTLQSDCLYLNQLFILPQHQGKRVGAECLRIVEAEAKGLNLPIRLRVLKANRRALDFYLREGFQLTEEEQDHLTLCKTLP
jgi:GNAT superfamily N-acetyltransferase